MSSISAVTGVWGACMGACSDTSVSGGCAYTALPLERAFAKSADLLRFPDKVNMRILFIIFAAMTVVFTEAGQ